MNALKRRWCLGRAIALGTITLLALAGGAVAWAETPGQAPPKPEIKQSKPADSALGGEIADWQARWELARILSYTKKYAESVAEYEKLLAERPDLAEARAEMARVLFWNGEPEKAANLLQSIPADSMDEATNLLLADLLVSQKSYDKAEPIYRAYLKKNPNDQAVRLKLAELLSWAKRYDEALSEYETILKARPDDAQVRRKYAFVLIWSGRNGEAIEALRETLD